MYTTFTKYAQLQLLEEDEIAYFYMGIYGKPNKFLILTPSFKIFTLEREKFGTYQLEKIITEAKDEEDFINKIMVENI